MSTQLAKTKEKYGSIKQLLESRAGDIAAALPRHIDPRRMIQVALGALRTNPALLECTQTSLLSAVMSASQLGLELDGMTGQAYLVPYGRDVTLQIGYRGLIDLARRSGQISSISARVVRQGDFFEYEYGLHEDIKHIPKASPDAPITHVYASARFKDGGFAFEVLSREDVEAIRRMSKTGGSASSPWNKFWPAMAKKTAIRQLAKYLPISVEVARAVTIDEHSEAGIVAPSEIVTDDGEVLNAIPDSSVVDTEGLAAQYQSDADDGVR